MASINVLLPTPGTPVIPIRMDLFACGKQRLISVCACSACLSLLLSIIVMARLNAEISPFKTPVIMDSIDGWTLRFSLILEIAFLSVIS